MHMDLLAMTFPDSQFDLVIDKATFDTIIVNIYN
jgi:hypothetical protein